MAEMIFFTNPECRIGQMQKKKLKDAGNQLQCKDLEKQDWSYETLLPFVRGRNPIEIMNSSAPDIRQGKIDPVLITFEEALSLMIESPILIKGPLIEVDGLHIQGANDIRLQRYLGETTPSNSKIVKKAKSSSYSTQRRMWDYWQNISQPSQTELAAA